MRHRHCWMTYLPPKQRGDLSLHMMAFQSSWLPGGILQSGFLLSSETRVLTVSLSISLSVNPHRSVRPDPNSTRKMEFDRRRCGAHALLFFYFCEGQGSPNGQLLCGRIPVPVDLFPLGSIWREFPSSYFMRSSPIRGISTFGGCKQQCSGAFRVSSP